MCVYDTHNEQQQNTHGKWVEYAYINVEPMLQCLQTHALQNDIYSVKDVCKIVKCGTSVKFRR